MFCIPGKEKFRRRLAAVPTSVWVAANLSRMTIVSVFVSELPRLL